MDANRTSVKSLKFAAVGLIALVGIEGWRQYAHIPVPGDVPTIGFGDTQGVKMGDKTDPVRALIKLGQHVEEKERVLKQCFGDVKLYQHEWDAYVQLAYNVGPGAVCKSSIVTKLKAGRYAEACKTILDFNRFQGKVLPGLVNARKENYKVCAGVAT